MRIVMITDDAKAVDRRILLEAESLIAAGYEVIVVARQDGTAPEADILGRVRTMWIGYDDIYLGGLNDAAVPAADAEDQAPIVIAPPQSAPTQSARTLARYVMHKHDSFGSKLSLGSAAWSHKSIRGTRRLRLAFGLVKASIGYAAVKPAAAAINLVVAARNRRRKPVMAQDVVAAPASTADTSAPPLAPESFEMNIWERALYNRALYLDPDIIVAHDLPQLLPAVMVKRKLGIPLVYDAHEVYPEIKTLTEQQMADLRVKEGALVHHCDILITVNPFCARFMEERYKCKPFNIILNATSQPLNFVRGLSDDRLRRQLNLPPDIKLLMYQGWIADVGRGLRELVMAMPSIRPEVHLVMMGYGDVQMFKELATHLGVTDRIHFLPPVPWDDLVAWSAAADAGVIPYQPVDFNHANCSPNKLFEFISAGLPIIANNLAYLDLVIGGEGFGLVRPMTTPDEMAAAVNEAFDPDSDILARARRNMLMKGSLWDWDVQAEHLVSLYAQLPRPARYQGKPMPKSWASLDSYLAARKSGLAE